MKRYIHMKYLGSWNVWDNELEEFKLRWVEYEEAKNLSDYLNEQENKIIDNGKL